MIRCMILGSGVKWTVNEAVSLCDFRYPKEDIPFKIYNQVSGTKKIKQ